MPSLSELKAASDQPRTGVWFDLLSMQPVTGDRDDDGAFYVCVAPRADRGVMRAARNLARDLTERNGTPIDTSAAEAVGRAAHVIDWENLTDDDGEEIECTPERVYQLIAEECPEYCDDLGMMVQLAAQSARTVEADEEGK